MPIRGSREAPVFNSRSESLPRYFDDLDLLFGRSRVTSDTEQKRYAVHYL